MNELLKQLTAAADSSAKTHEPICCALILELLKVGEDYEINDQDWLAIGPKLRKSILALGLAAIVGGV